MSDELKWQVFDNIESENVEIGIPDFDNSVNPVFKPQPPKSQPPKSQPPKYTDVVKYLVDRPNIHVRKIFNKGSIVILETKRKEYYYYCNGELYSGYNLQYGDGIYWWFNQQKYLYVYIPNVGIERYTRPLRSRNVICCKFLDHTWFLTEFLIGVRTYHVLARNMHITHVVGEILDNYRGALGDQIGIVKNPINNMRGNIKILNKMSFNDALVFNNSGGIRSITKKLLIKNYMIIWGKSVYLFKI